MAALQLDNYVTKSRARVNAKKNTSSEEFFLLLEKVRKTFEETGYRSAKANLNGIIVELLTNSEHQHTFWTNNWWPVTEGVLPHAQIYSAMGVDGLEPGAYYYPSMNVSLFINTEYYGQCKSWALGMAAAILEKKFSTLSIHGASAIYRGRGVVIIAPTGTGKTTQSFKVFLHEDGKICGDDWVYVKFPDPIPHVPKEPLIARQPEKSLYMRSEVEKDQPWLRKVFDGCLNENVTTRKVDCEFTDGAQMCKLTGNKCVFNQGVRWCYYSFGNSRTLVPRESLSGRQKVVDEVPVNLVVLLRRDDKSPPEVRLTPDESIEVLRKGEYMILPGAGPKEKWGTLSYEPWYNPYLLEADPQRQEHYFRAMFENWKIPCVILNTGTEGIEQTHKRIISALGF